ncbi:HAMP domain-containing histidine kinase [Corynebacterium sp. 153RC1]|uniref:sensor histidine kinase n=1 Tax=unclassified Corynebacterium TaxID=2624378 RepID=UPI00211D0349|nr:MULTISPECIES: HAMP domain-containing sensor histidine kinase [unclassified Corynebacterium]MCQ9371718.1 HAMP domain-containing histidine kinase [Corynebacterium sp. 35RC1]MCQ9351996.1 HAMP domain-containing histidine kinase [Corynebacterium sp. 209RC1]MCQ9353745.1 HAMP domain-containing histidine kinase [Corynebacterium sp. 1222RC1]MCQ9356271.1 HAMP domain-containing histidine kinase [Corynebacterium sp. 122RC1]MCQ9358373.1 HAMP domain-containing histidine kinase [Corynebacterium sp. 142RC1
MTTNAITQMRHSIRWRITAWILAVVFLVLGSMIYLLDSVRRGEVHAQANVAVEQEIEEFRRFSAEGIDPTTGQPFSTAESMLRAFFSQQIPGEDELMFALINGELVLQHRSANSTSPETLSQETTLVRAIMETNASSGITDTSDTPGVHWAKLQVSTFGTNDPNYFVIAVFTQPAYDQLSQQARVVWGLGGVGLALAAVIAWVVAAQVLTPVRELQKVASDIASDTTGSETDLTRRVPVRGDDEIAQLSRTFNGMLDRIEEAYAVQREFIDDAGHELRTPITVVRGHLELLEHATPEQRARSVELCTQELDRMTRMVNDLLTLAVADAGQPFLNLSEVDATDLVLEIEDKAMMLAPNRVQVREFAEATVLADPDRITEVMLEFVRNAVKYSPPDTPIQLASSVVEGGVSFSVSDRGQGIPAEALPTLFQRFHKGDSDAAKKQGSGLGLAIAQAIAQAHGGNAWAESTPGEGSTFGITIPTHTPNEEQQ